MEHHILVILHILGASIWIGGFLLYALKIIPAAKKENNAGIIKDFEKRYHVLAMIALTIQLLTGFRLGMIYTGGMGASFSLDTTASVLYVAKLALIFLSMFLIIFLRKAVLPKVTDENMSKLSSLVWVMTIIALVMLYLGTSFRFGL